MPAVLMAAAFGAFAFGKRWYPDEHVRDSQRVPKSDAQSAAERQTLLRIGGVFLAIAIFWLIYDQNADTWIYFAKSHTDLRLWGNVRLTANQLQALNPVFIVALTPVFNWIWNTARRRRGGRPVPDTSKMLVGFAIVVGTSAIMAYAGWLSGHAVVSVWWVVLATFVMTLAELCISPVGLEFAYRQAAAGTKSIVTAAFWMMVFVGDSLGLTLAPFYENQLKPGAYFGVTEYQLARQKLALDTQNGGFTVYIIGDMEGLAGVVRNATEMRPVDRGGTPQHERFRQELTDEVNAVIAGARLAGATQFIVNE